jgi:probable HAF family extracellular repeat protein
MKKSLFLSACALAALLAAPAPRSAAQTPVNSYTVITMGYTSGLNDEGHIVGEYDTNDGFRRAYLVYFAGDWVFTDLGTLGGTWSHAMAINNSGQVVGQSQTAAGARSRSCGTR